MFLRIGILLCLGGSAHIELLGLRVALAVCHFDIVNQFDGIAIDVYRTGGLACRSDNSILLILDFHLYGNVRLNSFALVIEADIKECGICQALARVGLVAIAAPLDALVQLFDSLVPQCPVFICVKLDLTYSHACANGDVRFFGIGHGKNEVIVLEYEGVFFLIDNHDSIDGERIRSKADALHIGLAVLDFHIQNFRLQFLRVLLKVDRSDLFCDINPVRIDVFDFDIDRGLGLNLLAIRYDRNVKQPGCIYKRYFVTLCKCFRSLFYIICIICVITIQFTDFKSSAFRNLSFRSVGYRDGVCITLSGDIVCSYRPRPNNS